MKTGIKIGLLLVLMAGSVMAGDVSVTYFDEFALAADTVGGAKRNDTAYTSYVDIIDARRLWVGFRTEGISSYGADSVLYKNDDTTFVNDTFFVTIQTSSDRVEWNDYGSWSQTVVPNTSGNDTTVFISVSVTRDSTIWVGDYARLQVACHHQLAVSAENVNMYLKKHGKRIVGFINKVP